MCRNIILLQFFQQVNIFKNYFLICNDFYIKGHITNFKTTHSKFKKSKFFHNSLQFTQTLFLFLTHQGGIISLSSFNQSCPKLLHKRGFIMNLKTMYSNLNNAAKCGRNILQFRENIFQFLTYQGGILSLHPSNHSFSTTRIKNDRQENSSQKWVSRLRSTQW